MLESAVRIARTAFVTYRKAASRNLCARIMTARACCSSPVTPEPKTSLSAHVTRAPTSQKHLNPWRMGHVFLSIT